MSDIKEKLSDLLGYYLPPIDRSRCMPYVNGKCNGMCAECTAEQLIANGVTVQKWIPVSERLPEHGEVVLCYMSFKEARALQWDNASRYWLGYGSGDDWSKANVTHWMPLPDVPKGE